MLRTVSAGHGNDGSLAGFHLLDVVQVFRKNRIIRRDKHRGQIGTDQRDDAMLELSAGMPFGKKVGDLLHFERAFERDGEVELPAEEKHAVCIDIFFGNCLNLIAQFQNRFDLAGQRFERFNHAASISRGKISHPSKEQSEERQNGKLRRKRFRSCDADLRPGVHVNSPIAFASDCARDVVTNSQCAKTFAPAFTQRAERIRGFAALADGENQRLRSHRRIAMAKLARVFDFCWNVGKSLDQIFADPAGMKRRATAGKNDTADIAQAREASCSSHPALRCIHPG